LFIFSKNYTIKKLAPLAAQAKSLCSDSFLAISARTCCNCAVMKSSTFRITWASFTAAASLALVSCLPSLNPLSSPETAQPDSRLEGVWAKKGERTAALAFAADKGAWMWMTDFGGAIEKSRVFPTVLGDARFLNNLFPKNEDDAERKNCYFFYRYEIGEDGTLTLWTMNEELFADAIRLGEIQGQITNENGKEEKILTDSSENLSRFIKKHGAAKTFSENAQTYHRLPSVSTVTETSKSTP